MKDDLVERCAREYYHSKPRNRPWEMLRPELQRQYRRRAERVLTIARQAILEEAAKMARRLAYDAIHGAVICHGEMPMWEIVSEADDIESAIRSLAHTTGQEG